MNTSNDLIRFLSDHRRVAIPAAAGVLLFLAGLWWLLRTEYVPLDAALTAQTRPAALTALREAGIPFRADAEGNIEVAGDKLADAQGLVGTLGPAFPEPRGFELLDKTDYTLSDFTQRLNYQRALEGELARTLTGLSEVRSARVHLSIVRQELFSPTRNTSKAAVTLQLKEGRDLSAESADGIREIVAASVEGLRPDNVAIIDETGRPLRAGTVHVTGDQRSRDTRRLELELERRVRLLLQDTWQIANPYVSVRADINYDKVTAIRDAAVPGDAAEGYLTREQVSDVVPGGEASTASGTSTSTREYTYGKEHVETEYATGRLTRLSIAVALPANAGVADTVALERVIAAAIGLQQARGDTLVVTVASVPSPDGVLPGTTTLQAVPPAAASPQPPAASPETVDDSALPWVTGLLAAAIAVGALLLFTRRSRQPAPRRLTPAQRDALLADLQKWVDGGEPRP